MGVMKKRREQILSRTFQGVDRCFVCEMQEPGPSLLFSIDFSASLRGMVIALRFQVLADLTLR